MKTKELAQNIYEEINFSHNVCISFLNHWIIKNIIVLNALLDENFVIENEYVIAPIEAINILKKIYQIEDFETKEIQTKNMVIDKESYPKYNRNAVQKSYSILKKEAIMDLGNMITNYKNKERN